MKVTVREVVNSFNTLQNIANTKISFGLSYKLKKIIDECNIVLDHFNKSQQELIEKYAELDEETKKYKIAKSDNEKIKKYSKSLEELLDEKFDIQIKKIDFEDLENQKNLEIEPSNINLIEWLLKV